MTRQARQHGARHGTRHRDGWHAVVVALVLAGLFARIWTPMAPVGWVPPGFCHAFPASDDGGTPAGPAHDHCPLCQTAFGAPPAAPALPTARFARMRPEAAARPARTRWVGWPAYASRAPPRI
jgi:hypothetical protein